MLFGVANYIITYICVVSCCYDNNIIVIAPVVVVEHVVVCINVSDIAIINVICIADVIISIVGYVMDIDTDGV